MNRLSKGDNPAKIKPLDGDISAQQQTSRNSELLRMKSELSKFMKPGEKITFSADLVYKIILPEGVDPSSFNPNYISDNSDEKVTMKIEHSGFTKRDIHEIIQDLHSLT